MTDEEILAVAHRTATIYRHRSEPESPSYGFVNHTMIDFARKISQAATAAERERCAKACESGLNGGGRRGWNQAMNWCADAIRKGEL